MSNIKAAIGASLLSGVIGHTDGLTVKESQAHTMPLLPEMLRGPHTGPYHAMPPTLVVVAVNSKTGRQAVREKRYISRNKYTKTKYPVK